MANAPHLYGEYCFDTINQLKGSIQVRILPWLLKIKVMKNKERRRLSTQWQNLEAIIGLILAILLVVIMGYILKFHIALQLY